LQYTATFLDFGCLNYCAKRPDGRPNAKGKAMKRIRISRDSSGNVEFETVTVDETENVFFLNLDTEEEHFPTIAPKKLGKAPSAPSDKCFPQPEYGCNFHDNEKGIINMPAPQP
jgi:hypothetical protein